MNSLIKFYNQSLERFTRNGCSIYTLYMIIQIQWGIIVDNEFIKSTLRKAEEQKVWYESWGAYFNKIYKWFSQAIYNRTKVIVTVKALDIRSKEFEEMYNDWYAFGLWLKYAWLWYKKAREDWIITEQEISEFEDWAVYWHNHTYFKWLIVDSLWSVSWKPIKMSLENLKKAVDKGLYYPTARTLVMKDKLLEKYLKMYQIGWKVEELEKLPMDHQKAISKASRLRVFKK